MVQPLRVYIVEDSLILQGLLISSIAAAGAEIAGCTAHAASAIEDISRSQPDVVVIDISLASGSGLDVLKALQDTSAARSTIKVVLTNYATDEYRELCFRLGANRFFDKSFETVKALAFITTLAAPTSRSSARAPASV